MSKQKFFIPLLVLVVISMLFSACAPTATEAPAEAAPAETAPAETASAEAAPAETAPAETEAPAAEDSLVGGTLRLAISTDPDTLDPHKTGAGISSLVMGFVGISLVTVGEDGTFYPYLAESWEVSEDGLTYTFHLRDDVKFHNGDPVTAQDVAFTYTRAMDPATASPATGPSLGTVSAITALDDTTVQFTLSAPHFPFLFSLSDPSYMMIMQQSYVEEMGEELGRNPMSAGPYKFVEWVTGDHVLLERNPDFNWGAGNWQNKGPWYIEQLEFVVIPEQSTTLAGLEAGEIDFASIPTEDVELLKAAGLEMFEQLQPGLRPYVVMQVSKPPFDDIRVRKAFNMAMDREAMIQILAQGSAVVQNGPLSPSQIGYWAGVEEYGYPFDLEGAKALMEEAGYTYNADGMAEKDGQVLSMTLYTLPIESWVKAAQVVQQQLLALGVEITIEQQEQGVVIPKVLGGDYQLTMFGMTYAEADILYMMFHSSQIGAFNYIYLSDPVLDEILERTRTETDPELRQQAVNEAQQYIAENAFIIPLYAPINYSAYNPRLKGAYLHPVSGIMLESAYIEE